MIGTIRTADAMAMVSANGHNGETVAELVTQTRSTENYNETLESIRRHGIVVPVLIRYEEVCNGTHRVTAAFDLGLEEIPFTDDPLIGWGNEFEWPEEKELQHCE